MKNKFKLSTVVDLFSLIAINKLVYSSLIIIHILYGILLFSYEIYIFSYKNAPIPVFISMTTFIFITTIPILYLSLFRFFFLNYINKE